MENIILLEKVREYFKCEDGLARKIIESARLNNGLNDLYSMVGYKSN